ncbi:class A beta-lactamase [Rhizobacter sp. LjRoot28]|uniref:class A beta-lactamase n=1 Tax=Rhizobacter sp. LjRoot28 TaxID=3342309 RepID=UPI003ECEEB51
MDRRTFNAAAGLLATGWADGSWARNSWGIEQIEREAGGRLGVAVLDTRTGRSGGHRLDERFPMCSTFKWLAAALVLHRVDQGVERLDRELPVSSTDLVPHSPVTAEHVAAGRITLAALCEATITVSDNAAANLILGTFGGPAALTRHVRTLGDTVTRLDRTEPALNEARPGDPRDTTSPAAMAATLKRVLLGDALSARSKAQLTQWMRDTRTSGDRMRARLPAGWTAADKTGGGENGTTNDVGLLWPPSGEPIVLAVYYTGSTAPAATRNAVIAEVTARVVQRLR